MTNLSAPIEDQRPLRTLWAPILGIGLTQLIGWGSLFTAVTVLGTTMAQDLGMPREQVFGGVTIMMAISAVLAPRLGRHIDAEGARELMIQGTLAGAVALLVVGLARGAWMYWFGWAICGAAMAMMMTNAAVPALVQIAGPQARKAVTVLTIITGLTSVVFLPFTAWLQAHYGWRLSFLIFALMFVAICLPVTMAVVPASRPVKRVHAPSGATVSTLDGMLPGRLHRVGFWLISLWMSLQGLVIWGFGIQVIDILQGSGLTQAAAISVWMFSGPSQAVARVIELASGGRLGIMGMAVLSAVTGPIGFMLVIAFGVSTMTASLLAIAVGVGQGLHAVARNLLPLRLFGQRTYGATMGAIALPLNMCIAMAPLIFSALIVQAGVRAAIWLACSASLLSFVVIAILAAVVNSLDGGDG